LWMGATLDDGKIETRCFEKLFDHAVCGL